MQRPRRPFRAAPLPAGATLAQADAEAYLESAAVPLPAGCRNVADPSGAVSPICWGDDASGAGVVTADAARAAM